MLSFTALHNKLPQTPGPDLEAVFSDLPVDWQAAMWARLKEQRDDSRFADGLVEWRSAKVYKLPKRKASILSERDSTIVESTAFAGTRPEQAPDRLAEIDAATYLEAFGVAVFPGGRNRCPFPDHEDRHPSASHRGNVWRCHRCGIGGGIYQAAAAVSGHGTRGPDFLELRRWIAERLIGQVAA